MATTTATTRRKRRIPIMEQLGRLLLKPVAALANLLDLVIMPLQRLLGVQRMGYFFVLPNLLVFGIFILLPMLLNFYYGFTSGTSILLENREFVGAANLEALFDCEPTFLNPQSEDFFNPNVCQQDRFWRAVANTAGFVVFQVGIMVVFALVTALALNRDIHGRGFFRSIFFYPVLLSPVVVALIWKWILQPEGVLNGVLVAGGMERLPFLVDAGWARMWVIIVSVWAQMGFHMLILLAGLQSIPKDMYEASSMDGAGPWRTFWSITLPLLMPTMVVVLVLSLIRAVQVFDQVFVLTTGGPGTATLYMVQYIFQSAFDRQQYGLAAASSLVLAVILFILTLGQLRLGRTSEIA
ncbi:MAG: sugar ABC transporter permease [Anaerolineae bacterium]|nr:sugar ABC transporter permease [Anaerolineae bacterium]